MRSLTAEKAGAALARLQGIPPVGSASCWPSRLQALIIDSVVLREGYETRRCGPWPGLPPCDGAPIGPRFALAVQSRIEPIMIVGAGEERPQAIGAQDQWSSFGPTNDDRGPHDPEWSQPDASS